MKGMSKKRREFKRIRKITDRVNPKFLEAGSLNGLLILKATQQTMYW